jgi:predicted CoA-substrate-specific enzyme activase
MIIQLKESSDYLIGMDVGSTTVKAVVLDRNSNRVIWRDYQRHETRQGQKVLEFLQRLEQEVGISSDNARIFFTGSGGAGLAEFVGGRFVQEVHAVSLTVEQRFPDVYSVIELGGQDSKIIIFRDQTLSDQRKKIASMNDKCAGGTGAVLDKIGAKLNIAPEDLAGMRFAGLRVHRVAGKCGVFSETDINSLQKQGIPKEELIASLFEAIVLQNLTVLTRGNTLLPNVLLLGGPNTFIVGMQEAWRESLPDMWEERGVEVPEDAPLEELIRAPEDGHYFGSMGAAEFGKELEESIGRYSGVTALEERLNRGSSEKARFAVPGLAASEKELEEFLEEFSPSPFIPPAILTNSKVPCFLGIDGGSTSTKGVLLGEYGAVLSKAYRLSKGNPIQDTIEIAGELRKDFESRGAKPEVLGAATTGYAKDVLEKVLRADAALVETVAHARSALQIYDDPDVIIDVGGQDIKLIALKDGHVKDFMLNTQCSAGNGYFLQATVESLGYTVDEYAQKAFSARLMPEFSYGCAVFLQTDIVNYQRQGWTPEELLAGLAAVLPKNIWLYVAKIPNLTKLGKTFILQGGTQRNLAAVKAQVDYIRSRFERSDHEPNIIVHRHCGEAGAIGAALEALRLWETGHQSRFIGLEAVGTISYQTTSNEDTRCKFCKNQCLRTFVDYRVEGVSPQNETPVDSAVPLEPGEQRLIVSTCEKGSVEDVDELREILADLKETKKNNPDLIRIAARSVWRSPAAESVADEVPGWSLRPSLRRRAELMRKRSDIRVGIPRALNLYIYAPFFSGYLESLGVLAENIVYSDYTNDKMYREGTSRGAIDPCFPSKVVIAHIHNLIYKHHKRKALDHIFLPMLDVLDSPLVNAKGTNACATVIATPQVAKAAFTKENNVFADHGIEWVSPFIDFVDRKLLARQLHQAWGEILGLSMEENERAIQAGFDALTRWRQDVQQKARDVIDMLESEKRLGILALGRPYHHDPGLNQGIFEEFQKLGYPILSQSTLPFHEDLVDRLFGEEVAAGAMSHPLDITDVWKSPNVASSSHKVWAAKFAARHPNLIAVEVSNFKCGHDAPICRVIEQIIERAGRPFFSFRDLDENKPTGSIRLRIETIHYFLKRHREELLRQEAILEKVEEQLKEYRASLHSGA